MNDLNPLAIARQPTQRRAVKRFDRIVKEAEALLLEQGLSGFSIPVLAERLRYTRGSVYAYFPTHYALLNELASRYLAELEGVFVRHEQEIGRLDWRDSVKAVIDHAIHFHNTHPVAALLILGGAVTDESYRAQEMTIQRLSDLGRNAWSRKGLDLPRKPVDVLTLSVELAVACFRRSFFEHNKVTREYRDAAVTAMTQFLEPHAQAGAAKAGKTRRAS